jgi:hypothetical protein
MVEKYLKYPFLVLSVIAIMLAFYSCYYGFHLKLPQGCDEFGYLNLAKAATEGKLFKDHTERPFDEGLLEYLKQSPYDYRSYEYMICPHAYYLHKKNLKLINEYLPGNGIVLCPLPFEARKTAAPAMYALLLVLFLVIAFKAGNGAVSFFTINLMVLCVFAAFLSDFFPRRFDCFTWINSQTPTFGILIAAGYLLDRKPGLSIALLGMSTLFRLVNVILFIPFLGVYLWKGFTIGDYCSKETIVRSMKAVLFLLAGGLGFYFLYVAGLLGNPFLQTYPEDYLKMTLMSPISEIPGNIRYHVGLANKWFLFNSAIVGLMTCMWLLKKMPLKWLVVSLVIMLFNYGYFFVHNILGPTETRYVFASGLIMAGILLRYAEEYLRCTARLQTIINCAGILLVLAALVFSAVKFPRQDMHKLFYDQIKAYNNCFSCYDAVWAETRSGTVEYATGKAGFRYQWGPKETRKAVISWLHEHGYRQAVWVSDLEKGFLDTVDVEAELKSIPVEYTVKKCPGFGTVIDVR